MKNDKSHTPEQQAFPRLPIIGPNADDYLGMTLRDYFAAAALTGMIQSAPIVDRSKVNRLVWAKVAYEFSDAMLKARKA